MHRFPKFFNSNSYSNKTKSKPMESKSHPSTPTQPKPKPRLDRRNASKNINYAPHAPPQETHSQPHLLHGSHAPPGECSGSNLCSSADDCFPIWTWSYPGGDRTSFRINGREGELEFLCKRLGFSGPDDLGISKDDYDAMKVNSLSDNLTGIELFEGDVGVLDSCRGSNVILGVGRIRGDGVKLCGRVVEDGVLCRGLVKDVVVSDWSEDEGVEAVVSGGRSGGVGIRGERPPAVLLSPPPRMALPVFDATCSSWDILRSFGPEDDWVSRTEDDQKESSSEDEGQRGAQGDASEGDDDVVRRGRTMGLRSGVLSDSSSFTSNDDDSSSTTTDPMSISPNGRFNRQISSWEKVRRLGSGSFGTVYEGIAPGGFFFAVKEVSLLDQGEKGREIISQLEREMAFLSQFAHKNIVRYLGTAKDDSNLYIFLELAPQGSLLSVYQRVRLQEFHVSGYTRQILEGLKYLHGRNVIHRDIKCANILLDVDGVVKLADFGLAKEVPKLVKELLSGWLLRFVLFVEVVKPEQGYGHAADIWSLGCTVLEVLTRNFPYHPLEGMQALFKIGSRKPPNVPDSLSRDARDFILQCLQVDPDTRPSAAELLEHPFVRRPHSSSPHHHRMRS